MNLYFDNTIFFVSLYNLIFPYLFAFQTKASTSVRIGSTSPVRPFCRLLPGSYSQSVSQTSQAEKVIIEHCTVHVSDDSSYSNLNYESAQNTTDITFPALR